MSTKKPSQESLLTRSSATPSRNMWSVRAGVRDFAVLVLVLNIINVLFYNTGWVNWRADTFDVIWATSVAMLDIAVIVMFVLLDR